MGTSQNVQAWLKQANTVSPQGDSDAPWTEGTMTWPQVNNYGRSIMSAVKKFAEDTGGALVAGGTATALTVTTKQVLSSGHLTDGLTILVRTASASTGAATIAADGLSAVPIKKNGGSAIEAGDWSANFILILVYSTIISGFYAANLSPRPSQWASFSAHKNGSNQAVASASDTPVTFGTAGFNVGGYYSTGTSVWTPPAGTVSIDVNIIANDISDFIFCRLYKNGVHFKTGSIGVSTSVFSASTSLSTTDQCNGTDYYGIYVIGDASYTITGTASETYFMGTMV